MKYTSIHEYNMFYDFFSNNIFYSFSGLSILLVSVTTYVILTFNIFNIFFLINSNFVSYQSNLKNLTINSFLTFNIIFSLLSLAGIPPFLGFFSKLIIISYFFLKKNFFLLMMFFLLNFFIMYFYIQNFRFLIKKNNFNGLFFLDYKLNFNNNLYFFIIFFFFIKFFRFFFF
jgi:NADH-quinone oxidoreductase subunit N